MHPRGILPSPNSQYPGNCCLGYSWAWIWNIPAQQNRGMNSNWEYSSLIIGFCHDGRQDARRGTGWIGDLPQWCRHRDLRIVICGCYFSQISPQSCTDLRLSIVNRDGFNCGCWVNGDISACQWVSRIRAAGECPDILYDFGLEGQLYGPILCG